MVKSDIEIAREAHLLNIDEIAEKLGIPHSALVRYGRDKAKVSNAWLADLPRKSNSKLVLVTAISPTPAGEGKTTTTVGLGDALNRIGKRAVMCLREPSLGPCFGVKGGAAGGGYAQVVPMEDINLHFTGDFHAITAAHNLLAALIDNHIYWGNECDIDVRKVSWRRSLDVNDRSLRAMVGALGGVANGYPRESGFDITSASEVMACFCLAEDLSDLTARLGRIVVGYNRSKQAVMARQLKAEGAMSVLLRDAFAPNLVQTLENNAAFIHGGPFANIAHGCNTVSATFAGLKLSDYVITEAGFGADLGAEKFFDIKCRKAGLRPDAVVIVATVRALKMHGGASDLKDEDIAAVGRGLENLGRHIDNVRKFKVPVVVAINRFLFDTDAELQAVKDYVAERGAEAIESNHWEHGGAGAENLARAVVALAESGEANFSPLYADDLPLFEKIRVICRSIYGAKDATASDKVLNQLRAWEQDGFGELPVCIAKTQYSFSTDASARGAPSGHVVPVREVRLSAGAGFVVAVCGDIMTMPGLSKQPAAHAIRLNDKQEVEGLF